jgi:ketosteroid isomerase-like protein
MSLHSGSVPTTLGSMTPIETMRGYFETWNAHDFDAFQAQLAEDMTFAGPLGTADGPAEARRGIEGLSRTVARAEVLAMTADGEDVITWFELHTTAGDRVPVASWAEVRDGRVRRVRATFDPRPLPD